MSVRDDKPGTDRLGSLDPQVDGQDAASMVLERMSRRLSTLPGHFGDAASPRPTAPWNPPADLQDQPTQDRYETTFLLWRPSQCTPAVVARVDLPA